MMEDTTVLYRFFDKDDRLLYVGITGSPAYRFHSHSRVPNGWWELATVIRLERFPTREAALEAEAVAIGAEKPIYNKVQPRLPLALLKPAQPSERQDFPAGSYYGLAEIAAALGVKVEKVRDWREQGHLPEPTAQLKAGYVWAGEDIEWWIEQHRAKGELAESRSRERGSPAFGWGFLAIQIDFVK